MHEVDKVFDIFYITYTILSSKEKNQKAHMDKLVLSYTVKGGYTQNFRIHQSPWSTTHIFFRPPLSILPLRGRGGVRKGSIHCRAPSLHGAFSLFCTPLMIPLISSYPLRKPSSPYPLYRVLPWHLRQSCRATLYSCCPIK